jgi:Xaa-Pro aminopeptidase
MISAAAIRNRWQITRARLDEIGIGPLIVSDPLNFAYFTGHLSREFEKRFRQLIFVLDPAGNARALVPDSSVEALGVTAPDLLPTIYTREPATVDEIAGFIQHAVALAPGRLGFEGSGTDRPALTGQLFHEVLAKLPTVVLSDASPTLSRLRLIKDEEEVSALKTAADLALAGWDAALDRFYVGMSVRKAAIQIARSFASLGADFNVPGHIDVRNATSPTSQTLELGDVLWCDFGVTFEGYHSDLSRRAIFGPPRSQQIACHESGARLLETIVEALRPGVIISECIRPMLEQRRGLHHGRDPPRRFGHGIGLCAAEPPSLQLLEPTILLPGMVLTPEPSFTSETGEFVHLEEMVLINNYHAAPLTRGADILYRVDK